MSNLRLTIVQYAGDYREAFERLSAGGKETYYAQRYSVNLVGSLAKRVEQVAVICAVSETSYDSVLANGVRAIGAGLKPGFHASELIPVLAKTQPTRLSLTSPMVQVLRWANANQVRTIAPLADLFPETRSAQQHSASNFSILSKSSHRGMGRQSRHQRMHISHRHWCHARKGRAVGFGLPPTIRPTMRRARCEAVHCGSFSTSAVSRRPRVSAISSGRPRGFDRLETTSGFCWLAGILTEPSSP